MLKSSRGRADADDGASRGQSEKRGTGIVNESSPVRIVAACMGLGAFALALIVAIAAGVDTGSAMLRAVVAMSVCYMIGLVIGVIGVRTADDAADRYRAMNPTGDMHNEPGMPTGGEQPA